MAKVKKTTSEEPKSFRPALTPEARENQIISLAMNTAEQRIRDNTASDTLVCHFLKLGTSKYQLELEKLRSEEKLNQGNKGYNVYEECRHTNTTRDHFTECKNQNIE